MADTNWELELNEYIRQGEPDKVDKSNAWKTAIGLQDVDGLKPSEYLIETAKEHIEGKITISEADKRIQSYYEERKGRNALVRANYNDWKNGIHATNEFLEMFFENLLMNANHELKNRYMHIDFQNESAIQSAKDAILKCKNCTLGEAAIIQEIIKNPGITQKELATIIGKSERTIKTRTVEMQDKGLIARENGKRNGRWIVPIWIMAEFRNKGYAGQAIAELERIYGSDHWCLDTILQEKGNLHLYEKMGYVQTGKVEHINERMDIVFYEKN